MTIPIYADKNVNIGNPSSSLKKQSSTVSKITSVSETKEIKQNTHSPETTSIQISYEAKVLNTYLNSTETESIDWNKVNHIKQQLESGTYKINNQQVAEKIINLEDKLD